MANVKNVMIRGLMPFNVVEHKGALQELGILNQPSFGLNIKYIKQGNSVPNEHGGLTAMYEFTISGEEAVTVRGIENMLQAFVNAGAQIDFAHMRDIEANEDVHVHIPDPIPGEPEIITNLDDLSILLGRMSDRVLKQFCPIIRTPDGQELAITALDWVGREGDKPFFTAEPCPAWQGTQE